MFRTRTLLAGAAAFALLLSACGTSDEDSSPAAAEAADAAPVDDGADADTGDDSGSPQLDDTVSLEVVAVDFAFEGLPESVDAGTRLTLRNDAEAELHELVAFRLPDDEERSVEEIMGLPPEQMQAALGPEPSMVMLAPPGSEQVAIPIGDGTLEEPGRYALICMIPTGADPAAYLDAAATSDGPPDVDGGPPHIAHGMYAELAVD